MYNIRAAKNYTKVIQTIALSKYIILFLVQNEQTIF